MHTDAFTITPGEEEEARRRQTHTIDPSNQL
jgi:hypothetical protein